MANVLSVVSTAVDYISKLLFSWQHSIEFGCRLYCLHGKRVVTIEYGTDDIVFMANVLLVLSTVVDNIFFMANVLLIVSTVLRRIVKNCTVTANVSVLDAAAA